MADYNVVLTAIMTDAEREKDLNEDSLSTVGRKHVISVATYK